ncbi:MAG TPA: LuxR C-terminal-related transcriptional regulator [Hanamia sp.]|nr:LuxR C-terminal-related transcriptional regulator [Hanamia sp.]
MDSPVNCCEFDTFIPSSKQKIRWLEKVSAMKDLLLDKANKALLAANWQQAKSILENAVVENPSAEVYEAMAKACWWLNDAPAVFENRTKAYQLYLEKDDRLGASRNACWLGVDHLEFNNEFAVASGWFQRAESLVKGLENTAEYALILMLKARLAFFVEKNNGQALQLAGESLKLSVSLNNVEGVMIAKAFIGFIWVTEGKISQGMKLLDEATLIATTDTTIDYNLITVTCCFLIDACTRVRDYERAGQWCKRVKEISIKKNHKAMFANCRTLYASLLIHKGEWKEAEDELTAAAKELKEYRPIVISSSTVRLADLRRRQGRWEEALTLFDEVTSHSLKPLSCAALAYDRGEYENAENLAERHLRQIPLGTPIERVTGLELLMRIYIKRNKTEEALTLLNELKETAGLINTLPLKAAALSAEGIYDYAAKKYTTAKHFLEDAVDLYDKVILPFEASRSRLILAEVLVNLHQYAQAEAELNIAINAFRELGAEKDIAKAKYILKNLHNEKIKPDAGDNIYEFTGRELEILRLIAEGKSNEEMAEQLFLSVRTIEKHISNLYQKMGISGKSARAFVVSYSIRHHLIDT